MALRIRLDDLQGHAVRALLREHLAIAALHSPPESIHALDLERLRAPHMSVWTAWEGEHLLACGALKELDPTHGEVKSMRTAAEHLRKGAARAMLAHIVDEARRRGYHRLSLETGTAAAYGPAHLLYAAAGFQPRGPFGDYRDDPYSCFMTLTL